MQVVAGVKREARLVFKLLW